MTTFSNFHETFFLFFPHSKKNIQKKQTDTFEESFEKKIRTTKEILSKIKEQVDTWEGNLYIAYIPWPKIDNGAYLDSNAYDAKQFSSNSSLSFLYNFRQVFPEICLSSLM